MPIDAIISNGNYQPDNALPYKASISFAEGALVNESIYFSAGNDHEGDIYYFIFFIGGGLIFIATFI